MAEEIKEEGSGTEEGTEAEESVQGEVVAMVSDVPSGETEPPGEETKEGEAKEGEVKKEEVKKEDEVKGEAKGEAKEEIKGKEKEAKVEEFVLRPKGEEKKEEKKGEKKEEAKVVRIGEDEYPYEEVLKNPELFDKLVQSARQFRTGQKTINDLTDRLVALETGDKKVETAEAAPKGITPTMMGEAMAPLIKNATEAGYVEDDFVALFPQKSALDAYNHTRLDYLAGMVKKLVNTGAVSQVEVEDTELEVKVMGELHDHFDSIVKLGPSYGALAEDEVREGFITFLAKDIDLPISSINQETLVSLYRAFCGESLDEALRVKEDTIKNLKNRNFLSVENGGPRIGPSGTKNMTLADEARDLVTDS